MKQVGYVSDLFVIAFTGVSNDDVIPGLPGYIFYTCQYRRNKVTVKFMQQNTNSVRFLFSQVAGKIVMPVA